MPSYLSPGVYPRETDFSFYVKQISTSSAAMVGVAEKGPINKPTLVTSWEQFLKTFGGYINEGYLAYAARSFFDNGGSVLYVCRVAHYADPTDRNTLTGQKAMTKLVSQMDMYLLNGDPDPLPPQEVYDVFAINEGIWANRLEVQIENVGLSGGTFHLSVIYKGETVERFTDVSSDENATGFVELRVNGVSDYITIHDIWEPVGDTGMGTPRAGTYALSGGDNGLVDMADSDYIGDPSQHTGLFAFDEIDALNLLMVPGVTTVPVINAGIGYAEIRKDLLFIADAPPMLEPLDVVNFRKGQGTYTHTAFNSSYAALYYPWLEISDPVTAKKKNIPPSGAVAGCCARSDQKTHVWWAPAGIDRGRIFNALTVTYKTSRGERDVLYPEGINTIAVFPDTGINIWGQKTLQSQPSAVDRVNVRRLMMYIEEAISESSRFVVFEPNNPQTWRSLGRLVNPFLQDIKEKGGLYDYAFQCDEETNTPVVIDRNEMMARVFVKPTKTAEFIELNFILSGTGAVFSELIP
jgi:phage tail sheath protein FI